MGLLILSNVIIKEMEKKMFLFKKKDKHNLESAPNSIWAVQDAYITYDKVLAYITGLSRQDFNRLYKVANIYRTAKKDANKILGIDEEPSTIIKEEISEISIDEEVDFLMDDINKEVSAKKDIE